MSSFGEDVTQKIKMYQRELANLRQERTRTQTMLDMNLAKLKGFEINSIDEAVERLAKLEKERAALADKIKAQLDKIDREYFNG